MRKTTWWIIGILLIVFVTGVIFYVRNNENTLSSAYESEIRDIVEQFGDNLKKVSLMATSSIVSEEMDQNYSEYVSPEILSEWKSRPLTAPGRLTSSPFPDRIEISSVRENPDGSYTVSGNIVEETNSGSATGTNSGERSYPVVMRLENRNNSWLIVEFYGYNTD